MAVAANTLTDYEVKTWQGSDPNANALGLGDKLQTVQEDVTALESDVAALDAAGFVDSFQPEAIAADRITNTTTPTAFATTATLEAGSLAAGDEVYVEAVVKVVGGQSTDTLALALRLNGSAVFSLTAFDVTDGGGDVVTFKMWLRLLTLSATGVLAFNGECIKKVGATVTATYGNGMNEAFDGTAATSFSILATWSVASASNIVDLRSLFVSKRAAA